MSEANKRKVVATKMKKHMCKSEEKEKPFTIEVPTNQRKNRTILKRKRVTDESIKRVPIIAKPIILPPKDINGDSKVRLNGAKQGISSNDRNFFREFINEFGGAKNTYVHQFQDDGNHGQPSGSNNKIINGIGTSLIYGSNQGFLQTVPRNNVKTKISVFPSTYIRPARKNMGGAAGSRVMSPPSMQCMQPPPLPSAFPDLLPFLGLRKAMSRTPPNTYCHDAIKMLINGASSAPETMLTTTTSTINHQFLPPPPAFTSFQDPTPTPHQNLLFQNSWPSNNQNLLIQTDIMPPPLDSISNHVFFDNHLFRQQNNLLMPPVLPQLPPQMTMFGVPNFPGQYLPDDQAPPGNYGTFMFGNGGFQDHPPPGF